LCVSLHEQLGETPPEEKGDARWDERGRREKAGSAKESDRRRQARDHRSGASVATDRPEFAFVRAGDGNAGTARIHEVFAILEHVGWKNESRCTRIRFKRNVDLAMGTAWGVETEP